jgi:PhnB protein
MADQAQPRTQTQALPKDVMRGVIPYITVEGVNEAAAFYQRAFGAKELNRLAADDGKRLIHCHLEINGGSLMLSDPFPEHGYGFEPSKSFTLTLVVEDADTWWNRAVEAGCEVLMPLQVMFWGDRYGQLRDPFQIGWAINSPVKA